MNLYKNLSDISVGDHPLAVAIGVFDGLHLGHREVIQAAVDYAKTHGIKSAVFTFSPEELAQTGSKQPANQLLSFPLFLNMLETMGVDMVFIPPFATLRDLSPRMFIEQVLVKTLGSSFVSCGENFRFGKDGSGYAGDFVLWGAKSNLAVQIVPMVCNGGEFISSTRIRQALEAGDIAAANAMLGYHYTIDFEVVGGNRLGRTLGIPTINQPYPALFLKPKFGVYATLAKVKGAWYTSVTSVGTKPTIGTYPVIAETYIYGFLGDLYGMHVPVEFLEFLRVEEKFDSLALLQQQIEQDVVQTRQIAEQYLLQKEG